MLVRDEAENHRPPFRKFRLIPDGFSSNPMFAIDRGETELHTLPHLGVDSRGFEVVFASSHVQRDIGCSIRCRSRGKVGFLKQQPTSTVHGTATIASGEKRM